MHHLLHHSRVPRPRPNTKPLPARARENKTQRLAVNNQPQDILSAIKNLIELYDLAVSGIAKAFAKEDHFHVEIADRIFGVLDVTSVPARFDFEHTLGIERRIELILFIDNKLHSITFGSNGYPIDTHVGNWSYPIVSVVNGKVVINAPNKDVFWQEEGVFLGMIRDTYLPLAQQGLGLRGYHLDTEYLL